jgi:hypothetical protein
MVVGANTLGKKMKSISKQADLSLQYTNHSIRATTISLQSLIETDTRQDMHIMAVSAHAQKREQYLKLQQNRGNNEEQNG